MDKLLLDTNFLLDVALEHRPGAADAAGLFDLAAKGDVACCVSPTSLKDFYYISRRDFGDGIRRGWIALFMDTFAVASLDRGACSRALASDEPDFEDGIIRALAESEGCTHIVSRDEGAFLGSAVAKTEAGEYLRMFG